MIHVDCFSIAGMTPAEYELLYDRASAGRRAKADRFRLPADRLRCVAAEALLRRALGRGDFEIIYHEYGKPSVKDAPDFHYNVSHAGEWVVIAWGGGPVGVDVERMDWSGAKEAIVRRHFTPDEQAHVFCAAGEERCARFYRIWTGKESYLKFLGTGLGRRLDSFSVLAPPPGIRFRHLTLAEGYSLTLCAGQTECNIEIVNIEQLF